MGYFPRRKSWWCGVVPENAEPAEGNPVKADTAQTGRFHLFLFAKTKEPSHLHRLMPISRLHECQLLACR